MKDLKMLIWLSQLGLFTGLPPAVCSVIGIRLHRDRGFGSWTVWAGLILGLYFAVCNFRDSLRVMERMAKGESPNPPAEIDHEHE